MMRQAVVVSTALVFLGLALMHLYWAAGGRKGSGVTLPQRGSQPLFRPSPAGTLAISLFLMMAAVILFGRLRMWENGWIGGLTQWGAWSLAIVFGGRAIGDFHWVGFFKNVRSTAFATWDTWLFTPLCVLVAVGCVVAARMRASL